MGDEGYKAFKDCAKENISPHIFEKNELPIGEDEVLAAIKHGKPGAREADQRPRGPQGRNMICGTQFNNILVDRGEEDHLVHEMCLTLT